MKNTKNDIETWTDEWGDRYFVYGVKAAYEEWNNDVVIHGFLTHKADEIENEIKIKNFRETL